uniref:Uncharacterized protein n=1 Tax=Anguilla anguilla TaxID=7936 RepID=A0A0E9XVN2_ANGAN
MAYQNLKHELRTMKLMKFKIFNKVYHPYTKCNSLSLVV